MTLPLLVGALLLSGCGFLIIHSARHAYSAYGAGAAARPGSGAAASAAR